MARAYTASTRLTASVAARALSFHLPLSLSLRFPLPLSLPLHTLNHPSAFHSQSQSLPDPLPNAFSSEGTHLSAHTKPYLFMCRPLQQHISRRPLLGPNAEHPLGDGFWQASKWEGEIHICCERSSTGYGEKKFCASTTTATDRRCCCFCWATLWGLSQKVLLNQ